MALINYCQDDAQDKTHRILITGPSGCGKSNLLLNLIYDVLDFDKLYFCAKDLSEPKYERLYYNYNKYNGVTLKQIYKLRKPDKYLVLSDHRKFKKEAYFCDSQHDMVNVNELDSSSKNLVVFDDCLTDKKQDKITEFFIRGRKKQATVIYLSQSYYATPVTIRRNCDIFIFFSLQKKERSRILREIDGNLPDIRLKPYEFVLLNTRAMGDKRYRINHLEF
jgi:uridine kinase